MSNASDFVIENGVLKKYTGCGGDVVIPDGVTSIGNYVFSACKNLRSIAIPDGVTGIGEHAFSGCKSLRSIAIPASVTDIGDYAFMDCHGLTSVTIPDSVTSIGGMRSVTVKVWWASPSRTERLALALVHSMAVKA